MSLESYSPVHTCIAGDGKKNSKPTKPSSKLHPETSFQDAYKCQWTFQDLWCNQVLGSGCILKWSAFQRGQSARPPASKINKAKAKARLSASVRSACSRAELASARGALPG